jgi:hypothetical protein
MAAVELSVDPMELFRELRVIAPDVWEGNKHRLILPQKLGDFEKQEYAEGLQNLIRKLNEYMGMLNTGLISESEYESKKAEILSKGLRKTPDR